MGTGAIIFSDLKNDRQNDVNFRVTDALRFEGKTGPYLQYTYARIKSMIRKAGERAKAKEDVNPVYLDDPKNVAPVKNVVPISGHCKEKRSGNIPYCKICSCRMQTF
jgi:arginyl-tRNA synthetase